MYDKLKDVTKKDIGRNIFTLSKVIQIKQTSGPCLIGINDGTSNFILKAFDKPGVNKYPNLKIDDVVEVRAKIYERQESIEGEVLSLKILDEEGKKEFESRIESLILEKIKIRDFKFSFESEMFESQKDKFILVAQEIRKAIIQNRPILLRHNADCDGYSSAICLERAILEFMREELGADRQMEFQNYRRAPSKAPFYEYEDCVKDLAQFLKDKSRYGSLSPLIIITDNGSTEEDLLSIKQMKIYGAKIIVIDHHKPTELKEGKCLVDKYVDLHINPYLTGFDSNYCCGMLGFEIANLIHKNNKNKFFIPAMASIIDHTQSLEKEKYLEKAKEEGYDYSFLEKLGEIIDMQAYYARFSESRELFDEFFSDDLESKKKIVELLTEELEKNYKKIFKTAQKFSKVEEFEKFKLVLFDGERGIHRGYPPIGKSTNFIHKCFEKKFSQSIITATYGKDFITFRVSDGIENFSILNFVEHIRENFDFLNFDGGGHEKAGSVRFCNYGKEIVLKELENWLKRF